MFWLFVFIPIMTQMIWPKINHTVIDIEQDIISCFFLLIIPLTIQALIKIQQTFIRWGILSSINIIGIICAINNLNNSIIINIQKILYIGSFIILFGYSLFMGYSLFKRIKAFHSNNIEIIFLYRLFMVSCCFFSALFMDVSGISPIYAGYTKVCFSLFYYLSIVALIFTIKHPSFKKLNPIKNQEHLRMYGLTQRETELIPFILNGKSNQAIADELHISLSTIKRHIHHIYNKIQVKSRIELANKLCP